MSNQEKQKKVETLTFVHRFSPQVTATLRVLDQPPPESQRPANLRHQIEWSTRPSSKIAKAYRAWIVDVNRTLSDRWNIVIMYGILLKPDEMEVWQFVPGQKPRLHDLIRMED